MGNKSTKVDIDNSSSIDGVYKQNVDHFKQVQANLSNSARSFASWTSDLSFSSVSRPWSRVSRRRRWKESTLTLPLESSKTAWPVSQLESCFLPEFPIKSTTYNEKNFAILNEISTGSFGKVYRVKDLQKEQIFALKVLSKSKIIRDNSVQQVKEEVQIQRTCGHHNFIVACPSQWQSHRNIYIVSEYIEGGELYNLLKAYVILPVALVQLYVAQIALAIDFLHNAGVIYRDLKPENLVLDLDGNLQLIDFGLSKWLSYGSTTKTICGTLRYMAPEILACQPYGHSADWWSLGIVACLMLTNKYPTGPMNNDNQPPGKLPENVQLDVPCKDLLLRLLEVEPSKRMRSLRTLETIAFYKGFHFKDVLLKKVKPNDLLKEFRPNGPIELDGQEFEGFDNKDIEM